MMSSGRLVEAPHVAAADGRGLARFARVHGSLAALGRG